MAFLDKLNFAAKTATEKANEAIGSGKLAVKIKKEEFNIEEQYKKIGAYYYAKRCEGLGVDPEVEEFCLAVDMAKASVAELQEQMKELKASSESFTPADPVSVEEVPVFAQVPCPACGALAAEDARFCPKCGRSLQ